MTTYLGFFRSLGMFYYYYQMNLDIAEHSLDYIQSYLLNEHPKSTYGLGTICCQKP
jgi:hypothetical protein